MNAKDKLSAKLLRGRLEKLLYVRIGQTSMYIQQSCRIAQVDRQDKDAEQGDIPSAAQWT